MRMNTVPKAATGFVPLLPLLAALLITGCSSAPPDGASAGSATPASATASGAQTEPTTSLLKEGDLIRITFPGATNWNTDLKIPLDGSIKHPSFSGEFKAAGRTPQQLQEDILLSVGPQLQLKQVTVTLLASSATVYVGGAVLRPGRIALDRPLTAMEAIMECGGFDHTRARPNKTRIIRQEDGRQKTYQIDLKKALEGADTNPFYLKPSDIVHVPAKTINL